MAYATVYNVAALNTGRTYGATNTKPSATQVVQYLEETAGVLDGILRQQGYLTPVATTATSAYKTLEGFNAIGAWCMVESAAQTSDRRQDAEAMWESAKKMLLDGIIDLDAPQDTTEALPRSSFGASSDSAATPFFYRDMEL